MSEKQQPQSLIFITALKSFSVLVVSRVAGTRYYSSSGTSAYATDTVERHVRLLCTHLAIGEINILCIDN